jgi:hypothetical protein
MKIKIIVIVLMVCAITAFAQEANVSDDPKNMVALDLFPLFKGFIATDSDSNTGLLCLAFAYERNIAPHFSIGAGIDMYFGTINDIDSFYLALAAHGRFYPLSENFENFFLGVSLGFNILTIDGDTDYGGFTGLTAALAAGYKLPLFKKLYLEPSMTYFLSKTGVSPVTPLGWQGGLKIGIKF